jgi:hypothetical protein
MIRPLLSQPKQIRVKDRKLVEKILERQGCCLVGFDGKFGQCKGEDCPHHIQSRGSGGGDVEGNILRVCLHHHQTIHNGLISKEYQFELLETYDHTD